MCQDIGACKVEDEHSFQRYWDHYMMGHNGAFPYKTEAQDPVQMEKVRDEGRESEKERGRGSESNEGLPVLLTTCTFGQAPCRAGVREEACCGLYVYANVALDTDGFVALCHRLVTSCLQ